MFVCLNCNSCSKLGETVEELGLFVTVEESFDLFMITCICFID